MNTGRNNRKLITLILKMHNPTYIFNFKLIMVETVPRMYPKHCITKTRSLENQLKKNFYYIDDLPYI